MEWIVAPRKLGGWLGLALFGWTLGLVGSAGYAGEDADEGEEAAVSVRDLWRAEEERFALALAQRGWIDFARDVRNNVEKGDPRVEQGPLSNDEKFSLRRVDIRIEALAGKRLPTLNARVEAAHKAVAAARQLIADFQKRSDEKYNARESVRGSRDRFAAADAEYQFAGQQLRDAYADLVSVAADLGDALAVEAFKETPVHPEALAAALRFYFIAVQDGGQEAIARAGDRVAVLEDRLYDIPPARREAFLQQFERALVERATLSHRIESAFAEFAASTNISSAERKEVEKHLKVNGVPDPLKQLFDNADNAGARDNNRNRTIRDPGLEYFNVAANFYRYMPENREMQLHQMKFLSAWPDNLYLEFRNPSNFIAEYFNPIGKDATYCPACHLHPEGYFDFTVKTEIFEEAWKDKAQNQQQRLDWLPKNVKGSRPQQKFQVEPKEVEKKDYVNAEGVVQKKLVMEFTVRETCGECHLHAARHDLSVFFDPAQARQLKPGIDRPIAFYSRYSDRIEFIFNRFFAWTKISSFREDDGKLGRAEAQDLPPETRLRGLQARADALTRSARVVREWWELYTRANNKVRADELNLIRLEVLASADAAVTEVVSSRPASLDIDQDEVQRLRAVLAIQVPWLQWQAEMAKRDNNPAEADDYLSRALAAAAGVQTEGGPAWRVLSEEAINQVQAQAKRLTGKEVGGGAATLMKADAAWRTWQVSATNAPDRPRLREEAARLARQAYHELAAQPVGMARAQNHTQLLENLARIAVEREQWPEAYTYLFQLLQEFNPRRYPAEKYAPLKGILPPRLDRANRNLRYVARQLARWVGSAGVEVEALRMALFASPHPDPDLTFMLADSLMRDQRLEEALSALGAIGTDSAWYALAQARIANIHFRHMQESRATLAAAPDRREALEPEIQKDKTAMAAAADRFLGAVKARGPRPEDDAKAGSIYDQENRLLVQVGQLPIQAAFEAGDHEGLVKLVDEYRKTLSGLGGVDETTRKSSLANALWRQFASWERVADEALRAGKTAEAEAAFTAAGKTLDEIDPNDVDGRFSSQGAQRLGEDWKRLAQHVREAGDTARADGFDRLSAMAFSRAERLVFENLAAALTIGQVWTRQADYEKAAAVYSRAVGFWNEGLFAPDYIWVEGRSAKDLSLEAAKPALRSSLAEMGDIAAVAAAPDANEAAKRLNALIQGLDWKTRGEAVRGVLAIAAEAAKVTPAGDPLSAKVMWAKALSDRPDLANEPALRGRVIRTALEAAWPDTLRQAPITPTLPTPEQFATWLEGFVQKFPADTEARRKAEILLAMHDTASVGGDARDINTPAGRLARYRNEIRMLALGAGSAVADGAASEVDGAAAARTARAIEALLENGLSTYLFGVMERGRLQKRSYPRARQQINGLFWYDREVPPLLADRMPEGLPTRAALLELSAALLFDQQLLDAQRRYARALAELPGRDSDALELFGRLVRYYPDDAELLLSLSDAYRRVALRQVEGGKYTEEASNNFQLARFRATSTRDRAAEATPVWWEAAYLAASAVTEEVLARKAANATTVDYSVLTDTVVRGEIRQIRLRPPAKLEDQARMVMTEIIRYQLLEPPEGGAGEVEGETSFDYASAFGNMLERLLKAGFTKPEASVPPPPPE